MTIEKTFLRDVYIITHSKYIDERGFFSEIYRSDILKQHNINVQFVQENHSHSIKNVIRGLHFQWEPPMGKLMRVSKGTALLVAVDIRKNSPTLGKYIAIEASDNNCKQLYAPAGFARGFCTLTDNVEIQYQCTGVYNSAAESGIVWNDTDINIDWPIKNPIMTDKDKNAQTLHEWLLTKESNKFTY